MHQCSDARSGKEKYLYFLICKEIVLYLYPRYTLSFTFIECTYYTLNYDICYTLYLSVKFAVNLDRKI